MKIKLLMKILFCSLFLLSILCFVGCDCGDDESNDETFTAQFIIDGSNYSTETYNLKDKVTEVEPENRNGYIFKGWYMDTDYTIKWNFDSDVITADTKFYGYFVAVPEETFNILYYDDGLLLKSDKILKKDFAEQFVPAQRLGYKFLGWFIGETKFDFSIPIIDDVSLTAKYEAIVYHVKFIADENLISDIEYTVENLSVEPPEVPFKDYYEGTWNDYELNLTDIEVKAKYTPIIYKAEYLIDDEVYKLIEFAVDEEVTSPAIPQRRGFTGEWIGSAEIGKNTQIIARYTPIVYNVTFAVGEKIIDIIPYTVLDSHITPPAVPSKLGYTGSWQNVDYELENVTIQADYLPIVYYATFLSDGITVAIEEFTIENKSIAIPQIPSQEKAGYVAKWEQFTLELENVTINSVLEPLTFNAEFYIDNVLQETVEFTVEDEEIIPPKLPDREGYTANWQPFEIQPNDIRINAIFTPITYYVTFISYESEVSIPYTVENKNIVEPEPTLRKHYAVQWQAYEITIGNFSVNAIYTPIITDGFVFAENPDGTLTVTGYHGVDTDILIPSQYNGKLVKTIGNIAEDCKNVTSIELCNGIETISESAFMQCEKLTSVILPQSLKEIENYAFAFSALIEIDIPDSVNRIGEQAFAYSSIKKAKLSDNLAELTNIFLYCNKLESLDLGKGITTIKSNVLWNCESLKSIYIPQNVSIIEKEAFKRCGIEEIEFENTDNWYICANDQFSDLQPIPSENLSDKAATCQLILGHSRDYIFHKENN